jgi:Domain of unknown function (DUF4845)
MKSRYQQAGMSLPGMLCIAVMLGFFVMCILKLAPSYFEYLSVKEIMSKVAGEQDPAEHQISAIRLRIANLLNTNQVYGIKPQDVEVFREKGKTYIDASYEVRIPLMWRIDAVMKYDDLKYEVGSPQPLSGG